MNYRRLGSAGLKVSELSFGSWISFGSQFGDDTAYDCMVAAYDAGVATRRSWRSERAEYQLSDFVSWII